MLPAWRTASTQRSSTLLDVTVVAMFMALSSPTRTSIGLASCSVQCGLAASERPRSEEHTSELQSLMRISYAVFCLKKKNTLIINYTHRIFNRLITLQFNIL